MTPLRFSRPVAGAARPSLLKRFLTNEGGASIEFGLLALPFFGLLFAVIEVAWVSFNAEQLQAAVDNAARQVLTGTAQTSNFATAASFTSNLLCPSTGKRLVPSSWDCSKLFIDIRTASDFASTDMTKSFYTGSLKYCLGNPSTIVVLRVDYPMAAIFPLNIYNRYAGLVNDVPGMSGYYHMLMGSAVFKTEPYSGGSPTC